MDWDFVFCDGRWTIVHGVHGPELPDDPAMADVSSWFGGPVWSYVGKNTSRASPGKSLVFSNAREWHFAHRERRDGAQV